MLFRLFSAIFTKMFCRNVFILLENQCRRRQVFVIETACLVTIFLPAEMFSKVIAFVFCNSTFYLQLTITVFFVECGKGHGYPSISPKKIDGNSLSCLSFHSRSRCFEGQGDQIGRIFAYWVTFFFG
jgi:hypothetical protein